MSSFFNIERKHHCNESCDIVSMIFGAPECMYKDSLNEIKLKLSPDKWNEYSLVNLNKKVTEKQQLNLKLDFPIVNTTIFPLYNVNGFTHRDILVCIYEQYKKMYEEELSTCFENDYSLTIFCKCDTIIQPLTQEGNCSICCDTEEFSFGKLSCDHIFHVNCIETWFQKNGGGVNCPLCRQPARCLKCDGRRFFVEVSKYKEIPKNISWCTSYNPELGLIMKPHMFPYRNYTQGKYGIYDWYLEDLLLQGYTLEDNEIIPMFSNLHLFVNNSGELTIDMNEENENENEGEEMDSTS